MFREYYTIYFVTCQRSNKYGLSNKSVLSCLDYYVVYDYE